MEYADAETRIEAWLHDNLPQVGGRKVKTWADPHLPSNWPFTAPLVHVQRAPGEGDLALTLDAALLDIDVYASKADNARALAEQVRGLIRLLLPKYTWSDAVTVSGTATITPPCWTPDPSVYRRSATYRVILHGLI